MMTVEQAMKRMRVKLPGALAKKLGATPQMVSNWKKRGSVSALIEFKIRENHFG